MEAGALASLRSGWRAAVSRPRLAVTIWLWGAVLGLSAAIPVWRWLAEALGPSIEAERALERFSLGLFTELVQYDRFSPLLTISGELYALALLGVLSNPLVAAGVLEVLASGDDDRPLLHRFMRGAGHFYGRFLRLLLVSACAGTVLGIVVLVVTSPIVSALGNSGYERAWIAAGLARAVLLGLVAAFVLAVTDIARARIVTAQVEVRGMARAWASAARFVLRHGATVAGSYAALGLLLLIALAAYTAAVNLVPAVSWAGIVAVVLLQQGFMLIRAALRVMRAGVSLALVRGLAPAPALAALERAEPPALPENSLS